MALSLCCELPRGLAVACSWQFSVMLLLGTTESGLLSLCDTCLDLHSHPGLHALLTFWELL